MYPEMIRNLVAKMRIIVIGNGKTFDSLAVMECFFTGVTVSIAVLIVE